MAVLFYVLGAVAGLWLLSRLVQVKATFRGRSYQTYQETPAVRRSQDDCHCGRPERPGRRKRTP